MAQYLKESLRTRIIEAAQDQFVANGFENASMRKIAEMAGMTAGNLYRYFKNKEAIYQYFLQPVLSDLNAFVEEASGIKIGQLNTPKTKALIQENLKSKKDIEEFISNFSEFFANYVKKDQAVCIMLVVNLKEYKARETKGDFVEWINVILKHKLMLERKTTSLTKEEEVFCHMLTDSYFEGIFTLIVESPKIEKLDSLLKKFSLSLLEACK